MLLEETPSKTDVGTARAGSGMNKAVVIIGALYIVASLIILAVLFKNLSSSEQRVAKLEQQQKEVAESVAATKATANETFQALRDKVGMTAEELNARTQELRRQQAVAAKLSQAQQAQQQQLSQVTGDVSTVKTELGGAKTDIANTRTDLDETKRKLESTIGDLNVQSGLIAHTRDDLEVLKHKGDRNYYEFTLVKNVSKPVSTISLQLKKSDRKKSKFTLNVIADDRTIEKKDRSLFEPMQFYTGRDRMLYELVVMTVDKDRVSGYLSTPKGAPEPVKP